MKVVKCLLEIPKELWGKVIEDGIGGFESRDGIGISYQLKPSDTFPLPQQGDEIEVSENGLFTDFEERKAPFMVYYKGVFVTDEGGFYDNWKYIRPIEQASAAVGTSSTTCISEADETLLALRDIQKDLHEIFEYLKDN